MLNVYLSHAVKNAQHISEVVDVINAGGITEGIESIEFTPSQLAGIYAYCAIEADDFCNSHNDDDHDAHLDVLDDVGAIFDSKDAIVYASQLSVEV